ncbi:MAG: flavin reductase family protein [Ruminococcaceae bacterium]|nr:flavin reductase family protein [Oscillospiraceae bacterium]
MAKVNLKGGALLAPLPPVLVSCGNEETGETNILTVAWTGILNTKPPKTYISVRPTRHSHHIIKESGEFVLNLTTESLVKTADYCGIYTGKKVDKFEKCKLTREKSTVVSCPSIAESPFSIECKVTEVVPMESHDMFLADIVAVNVDESLLDEKGKICLEKAHLAAFAHGEYFALGKKLGTFGFSTKKSGKKKPKR